MIATKAPGVIGGGICSCRVLLEQMQPEFLRQILSIGLPNSAVAAQYSIAMIPLSIGTCGQANKDILEMKKCLFCTSPMHLPICLSLDILYEVACNICLIGVPH